MGRKRKRRLLVRSVRLGRDATTPTSAPPSGANRRSSKVMPSRRGSLSSSLHPYLSQQTKYDFHNKTKRLHRVRREILRTVSLNAITSWAVTLLGYFVVRSPSSSTSEIYVREGLKALICALSLLQTTLVVYYWKRFRVYQETLVAMVHPSLCGDNSDRNRSVETGKCACECILHLFALLPRTSISFSLRIFGTAANLTLDDLCYISILLRNYHSIRLIFWSSQFSKQRIAVLADAGRVRFASGFVFRCFLAQYGISLVLVVYAFMIIVPGLILFILEHNVPRSALESLWNNYWLVSYTQFTIGYGEMHPASFLGQVTVLVSSLLGYFTLGLLNSISSNQMSLNLAQCSMYSELLYAKEKERYYDEACVLIQRWWRLMQKRARREQNGLIILAFYTRLRMYRSTLVSCQRVKDTRFERQIAAFDASTHKQFRSMNEYLKPVLDAQVFVQDAFRSEYKIKTQCKELCRAAVKQNRRPMEFPIHASPRPMVDDQVSEVTSRLTERSGLSKKSHKASGQGRAKARHLAMQNVIGRLAKVNTLRITKSDTVFSTPLHY